MTRQEAFDRVWQHFVVEKQPFSRKGDDPDVAENHACYYRHPITGAKCALGVLIPDDKYYPGMEGVTAIGLAWDNKLDFLGQIGRDRSFLNAIQEAHDGSWSHAQIEAGLWNVADALQLEVPSSG